MMKLSVQSDVDEYSVNVQCVVSLCTLQAYSAYLTGMVQFEMQEWKSAMEAFNKCK